MLGQNQTLCSFYAWGGKTEIWAGFAGDLFGILKQQFTLNGLIFARIDFFRICFCDNWIFLDFLRTDGHLSKTFTRFIFVNAMYKGNIP